MTSSLSRRRNWERVIAVHDVWDGPRKGIATFDGEPHVFESQFSEAEDALTDLFLLTRMTTELDAVEPERRASPYSSPLAFPSAKTPVLVQPALQGNLLRQEEMGADGQGSRLARGEFRSLGAPRSFVVRWLEIPPEMTDPIATASTVNTARWNRHPVMASLGRLLGTAEAGAVVDSLTTEAIAMAEETSAWSWKHHGDPGLTESFWLQILQFEDEAVDACDAAVEKHNADGDNCALARSLSVIVALLRRRPALPKDAAR